MLLRLRVVLGSVLCLLTVAVGFGQVNCVRKCRDLKTADGEAHHVLSTGAAATSCYTYDKDYGDYINSTDPTGGHSGVILDENEQKAQTTRSRYDDCEEICPNWKTTVGTRIVKKGGKVEATLKVDQKLCTASTPPGGDLP